MIAPTLQDKAEWTNMARSAARSNMPNTAERFFRAAGAAVLTEAQYRRIKDECRTWMVHCEQSAPLISGWSGETARKRVGGTVGS